MHDLAVRLQEKKSAETFVTHPWDALCLVALGLRRNFHLIRKFSWQGWMHLTPPPWSVLTGVVPIDGMSPCGSLPHDKYSSPEGWAKSDVQHQKAWRCGQVRYCGKYTYLGLLRVAALVEWWGLCCSTRANIANVAGWLHQSVDLSISNSTRRKMQKLWYGSASS